MLRNALAYPCTDDRWLRRLGIGGVVIIASFLIVPLFIFFGYITRVLRSVTTGQKSPPNFSDIYLLIIDGLKLSGITFAYGFPVILIPFFAGAFGEALGLGTSVAGSDPGAGPLVTTIIGLLLVGGIVTGVVSVYSIPAAVAHFAYTGSMKAAFDVRVVVGSVSFSKPYLKAYLLTTLISIVFFPVVATLSVVIVGILISVYQTLVASYLMGKGYAISQGLEQDGQLQVAGATPDRTDSHQTVAETPRRDEGSMRDEISDHGAQDNHTKRGSCPNCGRSVRPSTSFCPDCGTTIIPTGKSDDVTNRRTHSRTVASNSSDNSASGQTITTQDDTKAIGSQSVTQTESGADRQSDQKSSDAKPNVVSDNGDEVDTDSTTSSPSQISPEQLYTDETGTTYVETSFGPDKRLYTDSDGNKYYQRGQAMRGMSAVFAILCIGFALFAFFALPDVAGGPSAPRGRFFFVLIQSIPFGNVIIGLLALWMGYQLLYVAYTGREYIAIAGTN